MIEKQITPSSMNVIHRYNFWNNVWRTLPRYRKEFLKDINKETGGMLGSANDEAKKILFLAVKIDYPKFDELIKMYNTEENAKTFLYVFNVKQQFYKYVSDNDWEVLNILKAYEDV